MDKFIGEGKDTAAKLRGGEGMELEREGTASLQRTERFCALVVKKGAAWPRQGSMWIEGD